MMTDFQDLARWYRTDLGQKVLSQEQQQLSQMLSGCFGYHLLQIEMGELTELLQDSRILHRIIFTQQKNTRFSYSTVVGDFAELPFVEDSIDTVVLPHTLEFFKHPKSLLADVQRIVLPGGHVIILGFEPWSLWGMRKFFTLSQRKMPWQLNFTSAHTLMNYLNQVGFDVQNFQRFFNIPAMENHTWINRLDFMDKIPLMWGGLYIILARKNLAKMTPLRINAVAKKALRVNGIAEPTTRSKW